MNKDGVEAFSNAVFVIAVIQSVLDIKIQKYNIMRCI